MAQKEYFGFGSASNLRNLLEQERAKSVFLVTGKDSFNASGARGEVLPILQNYRFATFTDFSPNPKLANIQAAYTRFKEGKYDVLIAVGGGSAIDVAKAVKLQEFQKSGRKIPLIAMPTTAGSGSEATHFIAYYSSGKKQSEGIPDLTLPDYAIVDPHFVMNLPKIIAAQSGMDALAQAIESYWSVNSTDESKRLATKAIRRLSDNLELSVIHPTRDNRQAVMEAANLSGKAINLTRTTAPHSIAYPMTAHFNVAHGQAVGLALGELLVYNFQVRDDDCSDSRGSDYVAGTIQELSNILGFKTPEKAKEGLQDLMRRIGLQTRLSGLGIKRKDINLILKDAFTPGRVDNNPRILTEGALRNILQNLL